MVCATSSEVFLVWTVSATSFAVRHKDVCVLRQKVKFGLGLDQPERNMPIKNVAYTNKLQRRMPSEGCCQCTITVLKANSHRHARHDTYRTVLSCLAGGVRIGRHLSAPVHEVELRVHGGGVQAGR